ncbi:hypothetical protein GL263_16575 [Streptomyces durbertensis]|uniref:acetyl-CoA C-acetyltransferase n=1 Tax=Streptomyces durbertensis TaxID=2448886 RepID=A0ABR6EKW4_9ACTN|nr:hypothetical protein [Streptomyces durbertensis]MBB1245174.1 hypothetical protein [Streptomyces durbertensis]
MSESVLVAGARTPVGRHLETLGALSAADLGAVAIRTALDRAGICVARVDRVVMGHGLAPGVGQGHARRAVLKAGVPSHAAPSLSAEEFGASGMAAVARAYELIRSGRHDVVVAGGLENLPALGAAGAGLSGEAACGRLGEAYGDTRGGDPGAPGGDWSRGLRTVMTLARPHPPVAAGALTAARNHTRTLVDQVPEAAAIVVMRKSLAASLGLDWLAEISSYATTAAPAEPRHRWPAHALEEALERACLTAYDLDHVEADHYSAALAAPSLRSLGTDSRALPLGSSGPRTLLHLVQTLNLREGTLGAAVCGHADRGEALIIRTAR